MSLLPATSFQNRWFHGQSLAEKEFFLFFVGLMQKFDFGSVPDKELPSYDIEKVNVKGILLRKT